MLFVSFNISLQLLRLQIQFVIVLCQLNDLLILVVDRVILTLNSVVYVLIEIYLLALVVGLEVAEVALEDFVGSSLLEMRRVPAH